MTQQMPSLNEICTHAHQDFQRFFEREIRNGNVRNTQSVNWIHQGYLKIPIAMCSVSAWAMTLMRHPKGAATACDQLLWPIPGRPENTSVR